MRSRERACSLRHLLRWAQGEGPVAGGCRRRWGRRARRRCGGCDGSLAHGARRPRGVCTPARGGALAKTAVRLPASAVAAKGEGGAGETASGCLGRVLGDADACVGEVLTVP